VSFPAFKLAFRCNVANCAVQPDIVVMVDEFLYYFPCISQGKDNARSDTISHFNEAKKMLAKLYSSSGQLQKAIDLLNEILSIAPEDPLAANNLAWLYLKHLPENLDEAFRLAQLAFEQLPENVAVVDTMSWVYFKKK